MSQETKLPQYKPELFIGREKQIDQIMDTLRALIKGEERKDRVFAFRSERGTGKTWLLSHLRTSAAKEKQSPKTFWLNLEDEKYAGQDPLVVVTTVLEELAQELKLFPPDEPLGVVPSVISRKVMAALGKALAKQPLLVLVDHIYETDWKLLAPLEDYVLGPLAAEKRALLVLAGRGREYPWKTPELFAAAPQRLDPLRADETQKQIEKQVKQPKVSKDKVYTYTNGYPMQNYFLASYGFPDGLELSVQEILRQVDEHERGLIQKYLEALCALEAFEEDRIKWMLAAYYKDESYKSWEQRSARAVREKLVNQYGFARWDENERAYIMDSSVRLSVRNALQQRDVKRWNDLYKAAESYRANLDKEYKPKGDLFDALVGRSIEHITAEVYLSALATPQLVGRAEEIRQIKQCITDSKHSYVVYVSGAGGTGKTRLLQHLIKALPSEYPDALITANLIDLFHTVNRVDFGIAQAIVKALDPQKKYFSPYRKERENWLRSHAFGRLKEPKKMLQALLDEINSLAEKKRLVLFLDTAERFFYPDPAAEKMGLDRIHLAGQGWIYEFLAGLQNAVVIIAGRTPAEEAKRRLATALGKKEYRPIDLQGFSYEEAQAYFNAVIRISTEEHALTLVGWLQQITPAEMNDIYTVLDEKTPEVKGVLPLHLSLVIDHLALHSKLPDLKSMHIPDGLVEAVFNSGRPGADLLPYLSILPHGADEKLLAEIMHTAQVDEKWNAAFIRAYLQAEAFRKLAFVKMRPDDRRLYLHDEFYRWAQQRAPSSMPRYDEVLETIGKYYEERVREQRKVVEAISLGAGETPHDLSEVEDALSRLRRTRVEQMYYSLMASQELEKALDIYFVAAEEALAAEDVPLENMLTAEMQAFVHEHPKRFQDEIEGLSFTDINAADAAVRWLKRAITTQPMKKAREIADNNQLKAIVDGDALARVEWKVWFGLLQTYEGNHEEAAKTLSDAKNHLSPSGTSRQKAICARAYNNLGYLSRVEGRFQGAVSLYRQALPLWLQTGVETQEAYTLNNLAFAYAELGQLGAAGDLSRQAYQLRLVGGSVPIGLSLNTLAHIEIRDGNPGQAVKYAEEALTRFDIANYARGKGLAYIVLAEALRRQTEGLVTPNQVEQYLGPAIRYAEEGIEIFEGEKQPDRQVEAHIEAGCDYRDLAKYYRGLDMQKESLDAAEKSEKHLRNAAKIAEENGITYRQVDALVNLAWLKYYILEYLEDEKKPVSILSEAEKLIPDDYKLGGGGKLINEPSSERVISPYLLLLGKAELLRGQIAFYLEFEEKGRNSEGLRKAVHHYARALCYDHHFSTHPFRDLARGQRRIAERCRQLTHKELEVVLEEVKQNRCGERNPLFELLVERGFAAEGRE